MMHYDHISFHLDQDYPTALPHHHAAHHMGYYYAWAVSQNLHSAAAADLPQFADLQAGKISGVEFVLNQLNGGIDAGCFNADGNRFCAFYYTDDDEGYGRFMEDYVNTLNTPALASFYHVADTPANQTLLNLVFDAALAQWRGSLKNDGEGAHHGRTDTQ